MSRHSLSSRFICHFSSQQRLNKTGTIDSSASLNLRADTRYGVARIFAINAATGSACANLFRRNLRLLPGRKVPAFGEAVVVNQLRIRFMLSGKH
jgi:hypothetical protein